MSPRQYVNVTQFIGTSIARLKNYFTRESSTRSMENKTNGADIWFWGLRGALNFLRHKLIAKRLHERVDVIKAWVALRRQGFVKAAQR